MSKNRKPNTVRLPKNKAPKKREKGSLLTVIVVVFLVAIFVGGFIWGLNSVLAMEGAYPPVVNEESKTPPPENADGIIKYLRMVTNIARSETIQTEMIHDLSFSQVCTECGYAAGSKEDVCPACGAEQSMSRDNSFRCSGSDTMQKTLDYMGTDLLDTMHGNYMAKLNKSKDAHATAVMDGDKVTAIAKAFDKQVEGALFPDVVLSAAEVVDYTVDYIDYVCPSCGETAKEPLPECEACGGTHPYNETYRDNYDVLMILQTNKHIQERNFITHTDEELHELFGDGFKDVLTVGTMDTECQSLFIRFKVDRLTNHLLELELESNTKVTTTADFTGKYADLCNMDVCAYVCEKQKITCTWPSLVLSKHAMVIEPKKQDNLLATLTCDDPTVPVITWTSSDEDVLTVDEEGYMKAGKTPGKATITASFEFMDQAYSDTCEVTVAIPVESIKLSQRKLSLNTGDSKILTAKVSPAKATTQTVTWYTKDKSIATVDENGQVTAVAPGTVTVYALSDDGYFKSSCEVTVR